MAGCTETTLRLKWHVLHQHAPEIFNEDLTPDTGLSNRRYAALSILAKVLIGPSARVEDLAATLNRFKLIRDLWEIQTNIYFILENLFWQILDNQHATKICYSRWHFRWLGPVIFFFKYYWLFGLFYTPPFLQVSKSIVNMMFYSLFIPCLFCLNIFCFAFIHHYVIWINDNFKSSIFLFCFILAKNEASVAPSWICHK